LETVEAEILNSYPLTFKPSGTVLAPCFLILEIIHALKVFQTRFASCSPTAWATLQNVFSMMI
jgi:hypothetical protein